MLFMVAKWLFCVKMPIVPLFTGSRKERAFMDWESLKKECGECKKCALWETRTNVVFGVGNEKSNVMFIGEGPGENEDLTGIPFVGRAGKLLDEMLAIIDLNRENTYIANMVKCRPPKNRDPLETEKEACMPWLREQTRLINPKIIVCLGRVAATTLIKPDFKISAEHGQWTQRGETRLMALYHPAALLRDPRRRPETFDDLKELQRVIREVCPDTYR